MKCLSVVGARPQFIKAAVISRKIRSKKNMKEILVHTGQHYDTNMSKVFFDDMGIPEPDYNLNVGSGSHGVQTGLMLIRLEECVMNEKPDVILVYGDTNSTLAGALVGAKLHITVAHVEAGLRSFDMRMPEEVNRVLTDRISSLLFCPSRVAVDNLRKEAITNGVHNVGDVMYDAILYYWDMAVKKSNILKELSLNDEEYILATVHRDFNTDDPRNLKNIIDAFVECKEKIVFPAHPRTVKMLKEFKLYDKVLTAGNVKLIKPVGYLDFIRLEIGAKKIVTDSGGIQKEAYFLHTPCITLRESTEWVELVEKGWNVLVGMDEEKILSAINLFSVNSSYDDNMYGNGSAGKKIIEILSSIH